MDEKLEKMLEKLLLDHYNGKTTAMEMLYLSAKMGYNIAMEDYASDRG